MSEQSKCGLCGEPMPDGEEMFKYHGYSGSCARPLKKTSGEQRQMTWDEVVAEMVKRGDRIRELEAAFNLADEKWSTVSTKLEKAEAALARVKELPERWRKSVIIIPTQQKGLSYVQAKINAKDCADELEAALAEPITCSKPESICKADDNKEPEHE